MWKISFSSFLLVRFFTSSLHSLQIGSSLQMLILSMHFFRQPCPANRLVTVLSCKSARSHHIPAKCWDGCSIIFLLCIYPLVLVQYTFEFFDPLILCTTHCSLSIKKAFLYSLFAAFWALAQSSQINSK